MEAQRTIERSTALEKGHVVGIASGVNLILDKV
jgi:hypothetical protein